MLGEWPADDVGTAGKFWDSGEKPCFSFAIFVACSSTSGGVVESLSHGGAVGPQGREYTQTCV